ncbi:MAG: ABC transporter ATP-binding protein [Oscillospiraceae bacterium]|nr:ABC transporter ATP-binding protein [Oscillospiraceae bacterium]
MLKVSNLITHYDKIRILNDVSLEVGEGEIVTLVGANGAGKTTLLKAISGLIHTTAGSITYKNHELVGMTPEAIAALGVAHVPEGRHVFPGLSIEENLLMGAFLVKDKAKISESMALVYEMLPKLYERRKQLAGSLSGGEQQMLALGRALMSRPSLMLLDEPSMGLAPVIVDQVFKIIEMINKSGTSILLIEQNANIAFEYAKHAYVIETGCIKLSGLATDLAKDDSVRRAYLGMDM